MADKSENQVPLGEASTASSCSPRVDYKWDGTVTRHEALYILNNGFDKDDPHWEFCIGDKFYNEDTDTLASWYDILGALGVTREEIEAARFEKKENDTLRDRPSGSPN